jgi:hypothetical protein
VYSDISVVTSGDQEREEEVQSVEVMVRDQDEIEVRVNGKVVPADRLERDGNRIIIRNDKGEEIHTINTRRGGEVEVKAELREVAQPAKLPVMIGIRMTEPGDPLRAHLNLGDRKVIMIEEAIEGLPAAAAGVRTHDIVIAIDGTDDATPEVLQKVLMGKKPGDILVLRVLRGGEKKTIEVKVKEFDPEKLGASAPSAPASIANPLMTWSTQGGAQSQEELEKMMVRLREHVQDENIQRDLEQMLRNSVRITNEQKVFDQGVVGGLRHIPMVTQGGGGTWVIDGENRVIEFPKMLPIDATGAPMGDAFEQRIEALEKRVEGLSAQLEVKMEKLIQRFETMADRLEQRLRNEN